MPKAAGGAIGGLVLLACFAFPFAAHHAVATGLAGPLRVLLLAVPLVALAAWTVRRPGARAYGLAALTAAVLAVAVLERSGGEGLAAAYGIPHAAGHGFLLWLFARTLTGGREPLVTTIARRVHGALRPEIEAYTRNVTLAWSLFFAAQLGGSLLLLLLAPLPVWSFFVNVLNLPLVALMFALEYAWRVTRYPEHPRATLARTLRAFAGR